MYHYSVKIVDSEGTEFRTVTVTKKEASAKLYEHSRQKTLLDEAQCIQLGITQSPGWSHYGYFTAGEITLLFRRPKPVVATPQLFIHG